LKRIAIIIITFIFTIGVFAQQNSDLDGFIKINGGTFVMGSPDSEYSRNENEGPQRNVIISSFYIGIYPVTQGEYSEIMRENPSQIIGNNLPIVNVSFTDAIEYCNARSIREGLTPTYTISNSTTRPPWGGTVNSLDITINIGATGYRLPTEAEWEYACRAGTITPYNTGLKISDNTGWYEANSGNSIHPVGQKPPNKWGLYDMHGNIFEMCWDRYDKYPTQNQSDLIGPLTGRSGLRVARGGCYKSSVDYLRSGKQLPVFTIGKSENIGFRLVRPLFND